MEILKNILEYVFILLPIFAGGGFLIWKVIQIEEQRSAKWLETMEAFRLTCNDFRFWLLRNLKKDGVK